MGVDRAAWRAVGRRVDEEVLARLRVEPTEDPGGEPAGQIDPASYPGERAIDHTERRTAARGAQVVQRTHAENELGRTEAIDVGGPSILDRSVEPLAVDLVDGDGLVAAADIEGDDDRAAGPWRDP